MIDGIRTAAVLIVTLLCASAHASPVAPCDGCVLDLPKNVREQPPMLVVLHGDREHAKDVAARWRAATKASGWVLLVGVLWIVAMTYICYRGIEVSANFQKVLLSVEVVMLLVFSVVALVKVGNGSATEVRLRPTSAT